jgi:hypothetical protein
VQKATVGGILGIVASVLGILTWLPLLFTPFIWDSFYDSAGITLPDDIEAFRSVTSVFNAFAVGLFIIILIIGILGVVGCVFAIKRRVLGLALTGAIASSIMFYPLGIVSVVLVSMGYKEFKKEVPAAVLSPAPLAPPAL